MKGELTIRNKMKSLKLIAFEEEAFLFEDHIYIMLHQSENIKKGQGIPCFCINIPGIVFLPHATEIEPIDLEVIAT